VTESRVDRTRRREADPSSAAQAELERSVAVERVGHRIGVLSGEVMTAVDEDLRLHLGL